MAKESSSASFKEKSSTSCEAAVLALSQCFSDLEFFFFFFFFFFTSKQAAMCEVQDSIFSSLADVQQIGVFPLIPKDELRSRPPIGRLLYKGDEMCELEGGEG